MNLPFQPVAGSHSSKRITESGAALTSAATRQKAGKVLYGGATGPASENGFSGVNAPAATLRARVIFVCGSVSFARAPQSPAAAKQLGVARPESRRAVNIQRMTSSFGLGLRASLRL